MFVPARCGLFPLMQLWFCLCLMCIGTIFSERVCLSLRGIEQTVPQQACVVSNIHTHPEMCGVK